MIVDALLQFSGTVVGNTITPQSIVGSGTITSTNVVDLAGVGTGNTARDIGQGEDLNVEIGIVAGVTGATAVTFNLVLADDTGISVNVETVASTGAVPIASLTAGALIALHVDRAIPQPARRYMALQYVLTGTSTAGSVTAAVVKNFQDRGNNTLFNSGFVVA